MKGIWQAVVVVALGAAFIQAEEAPKTFEWDAPKVAESMFTRDLGMLDSERDEYATNLAGLAVNQVVAAKAAPAAMTDARHMIALALHLSPRNKRALVANFQLTKGVLPEVSKVDYSPQVFARLLLTRGQLLEKQGGDENQGLARIFVQIAAGLDPKNEDAVYASEVQRLDHGDVDWSTIAGDSQRNPDTRKIVAAEIERKFLVSGDSWRDGSPGVRMAQGYLSLDPDRTVRVRLAGEHAWLTIKGRTRGITRMEFEYPIRPTEARELLDMCLPSVIDKTRHRIEFGCHVWEVDVFHGANEGLVVAEVELDDEATSPELPPWVGAEVSDDARYFNASLASRPYCSFRS